MAVEQITTLEGLDEDVFFADLKDRISRIIIEDEDSEEFPVANWPSDPVQAFSYRTTTRTFFVPPQFTYHYEAPYRREAAKGTGVFIPTSTTLPKKKNRSGRPKQAYKVRKTGRLDPHPTATPPPTNRLSNSHPPSTCTGDTSLAKKHRQQLSSRKKEMLIC